MGLDNIHRLNETPEIRYRRAVEAFSARRYTEALQQAKSLIDEGFAHANVVAGVIYEKGGNGVSQDLPKAKFYFERATEQVGAVEGWLGLARLNFLGINGSPDYQEAFRLYKVVYEDCQHVIAATMLGRMHLDGLGTTADLATAHELLSRAASTGNIQALEWLSIANQRRGLQLTALYQRIRAKLLFCWLSKVEPADPRFRRL